MKRHLGFAITLILLAGCAVKTHAEGGGTGWITYTALNAQNERRSEVGLINVDGNGQGTLANSAGMGSGFATAWSPDGKWVAYIIHESGSNWPLYISGEDGEHRQRMMTGDLYHFPSWSPDGTHLAYSRNGNIWIGEIVLEGETFRIENEQQLTFLDQQFASSPSWSPDGEQIVFASQMGNAHGTAAYDDPNTLEIYVINCDGSGLQQLTWTDYPDYAPDWSPDGEWILFMSYQDGNDDIYVMRPDGTDVRRLTDDPSNDRTPAWSPDGEWIAFVSDRTGNYEVYVMQADGSQPRQLTETTSRDSTPAWQP